jgi:hypothetical protein
MEPPPYSWLEQFPQMFQVRSDDKTIVPSHAIERLSMLQNF